MTYTWEELTSPEKVAAAVKAVREDTTVQRLQEESFSQTQH